MTNQLYQELPPAQRRRLIFRAVLRGLLGTTVLVVLYYVLPLDKPWNGDTAVRVLIGLLVFAGLTVWQVRTIAGSRYPGVKAFEALGITHPVRLRRQWDAAPGSGVTRRQRQQTEVAAGSRQEVALF